MRAYSTARHPEERARAGQKEREREEFCRLARAEPNQNKYDEESKQSITCCLCACSCYALVSLRYFCNFEICGYIYLGPLDTFVSLRYILIYAIVLFAWDNCTYDGFLNLSFSVRYFFSWDIFVSLRYFFISTFHWDILLVTLNHLYFNYLKVSPGTPYIPSHTRLVALLQGIQNYTKQWWHIVEKSTTELVTYYITSTIWRAGPCNNLTPPWGDKFFPQPLGACFMPTVTALSMTVASFMAASTVRPTEK